MVVVRKRVKGTVSITTFSPPSRSCRPLRHAFPGKYQGLLLLRSPKHASLFLLIPSSNRFVASSDTRATNSFVEP